MKGLCRPLSEVYLIPTKFW